MKNSKIIKIPLACDAGSEADFRKIRGGTDRAAILKKMNGTKSAEQIAKALGEEKFTARYIMQHVYCLRRDCGIGYKTTEKGKLLAIYPGDHTYGDTVKKQKVSIRPAPAPAPEQLDSVA